jgi:hypothetical protein
MAHGELNILSISLSRYRLHHQLHQPLMPPAPGLPACHAVTGLPMCAPAPIFMPAHQPAHPRALLPVPVSAEEDMIGHFTQLCGARQPQVGDNLAEWMLELSTAADREGSSGGLADTYEASELCTVGGALASYEWMLCRAARGGGGISVMPHAPL